MDNVMLNAALAYARAGIPVFPCKPDKTPLTTHGFKNATTDEAQIRAWWTTWPNAMIGMPTGKASGLWVLDVDRPKKEGDADGFTSLVSLHSMHGELPATWTQQTPSGGIHYIFLYPQDNVGVPCSTGMIGPRLDIRGDGGYVIVAPSVNGDGIPYRIINQASATYAPESLDTTRGTGDE